MPFFDGPKVDRQGEPDRTGGRLMILIALEETRAGILQDLEDSCGEARDRVLKTAGPHSEPRQLLYLPSLRTAEDRSSPRAKAQAILYRDLLEWALAYRLTDEGGTKNRWLLEHALGVLLGRSWRGLSSFPRERTEPATEFRRRKHSTPPPDSTLGPLARDFVLLVKYALTQEAPSEFAPGLSHDLIIRRVQAAADRAGFDLPDPLRVPDPD